MPARSKRQARFMGLIAGGGHPREGGEGLTQEKAKEWLRGVNVKKLPETAGKKKRGALARVMKGERS